MKRKFLLAMIFLFTWIFLGQLQTLSFAQEDISTLTELNATSTAEITTSLQTTATSTPVAFSSPIIEQLAKEDLQEEEVMAETQVVESSELSLSFQKSLKERKLEKLIILDKKAKHRCQAGNFTIDISNQNSAIVELGLNGKRGNFENLEIGSLPKGIDITFFNNADYSLSPLKSENHALLQIVNQVGSQKGNFSIPIIYQRGNSTVVCQINVINF
ncbi:MAG: hypothetical protein AAB614_02960 [Patescibacteria group bacterium]